MSPRRSAADALRTRERVISEGVAQASADGLAGVTIGSLATALGMSKAGVVGPFGTKERLQSAVLDTAASLFLRSVVEPALQAPAGLARLVTVVDRWTAYLEDSPFPNGCFITAASCELDGRPGPLRDALVEIVIGWRRFLADEIEAAQQSGAARQDMAASELAAMLNGIAMVANQDIQLLGEPGAARRARQQMLTILGIPATPAAPGDGRPHE